MTAADGSVAGIEESSTHALAKLDQVLPADAVRAGLFSSVPGEIEDRGAEGCAVRLSAESADLVVQFVAAIAALGAEFTLDASPEITDRVRELGRRLTDRSSLSS